MTILSRSHVVLRRQFCSSVMRPLREPNGIRKYEWYKPAPAEFGSERFWLERRIAKYKDLMGRLQWPIFKSFKFSGKTIPLPAKLDRLPLMDVPNNMDQNKLRFLGSFFGTSGTVRIAGPTVAGLSLSVRASPRYADVLHEFLCYFGGSIGIDSVGKGSCEPCLRWLVCGEVARRVSDILLTVPCRKHHLLEFTKDWPKSLESRQRKAIELQRLNRSCPGEYKFDGIESLSGFLDRRLYIDVCSSGRFAIRLQSNQKILLEQFSSYLCSIGMDPGHIATIDDKDRNRSWRWHQFSKHHSMVLLRAVHPYLVRRKPEVDYIFTNIHRLKEIRRELSAFRSNIKRFDTDDPYAAALSRKINRLQTNIISKGYVSPLRAERYKNLVDERLTCRLAVECTTRRDFLRRKLDYGCIVVPPGEKPSRTSLQK